MVVLSLRNLVEPQKHLNMAVILDYNGTPNIWGFEKNIFDTGLFSRFDRSRMGWQCTNPKYTNFLRLVQINDERWGFCIDWNKMAMSSQQEYFTIKVMYNNQVKQTQDFVVNYPQRELTLNDMEVKLDRNRTLWCTEGTICNMMLKLKSCLKHWMFSDKSVEVSISGDDGFKTDGFYTIALKDIENKSYNIPISFNGYSASPIKDMVSKNIRYTINAYNDTLLFQFAPRPYSYAASIEPLNGGKRRYGSDVYDLFRIRIVRKDKYSPVSDRIDVCHKKPNTFSDYFSINKDGDDYVIALKREFSWQRYSEGIKATITFSVDDGRSTFETNFSVGSNGNVGDNHHFQIERGVAPELDINSVTTYVGEECLRDLMIKNKCNAKISFSISRDSNLVNIINKERFTIDANGKHLVKYRVNTEESCSQDVSFKISSAETESLEKNVRIVIKELENSKIRIAIDKERQQTLFLHQELAAGTPVANVIVENIEDGIAHTRPLRLSDIKFSSGFSLSDEYKDVCIEKGKKERVVIVTTSLLTIDENNTIHLEGVYGKFEIDWSYYGNNNKIEVPVVELVQPRIQIELSHSEELVLGQKINEGQKIASVIIRNCEQEDALVYPARISDIILQKNFSFAKSETLELDKGKSGEFDIVVTDAFTINKEDIDNKSLILKWQYYDEKRDLHIPVITPSFYDWIYTELNDHGYTFAHPVENAIKITTLKFCDNGENKIWWENQHISIEEPFSFNDTDDVRDIAIVPNTDIPVYVYIPNIGGLDYLGLNIAKDLPLGIKMKLLGDYKNGKVKYEEVLPEEEICIHPINEEPVLEVSFHNDGESVVLSDSEYKKCKITMSQTDDDTVAVCIGNIVIANKANIPYKNNAVRISINGIDIKELNGENSSENLLHDRTSIPTEEIEIFNGESKTEEIPLYIDRQKWVKVNQGNLFVEISLKDYGMENDALSRTYRVNLEIRHTYVDGVYALDLGTTGIVMAKNDDDGISCITLKDVAQESQRIERDAKILSSHILLSEKDDNRKFTLAPTVSEYYGPEETGERKYRLVPMKFIVGQSKIPFLSDFYNDGNEDKITDLFELKDYKNELKTIDLKLSHNKEYDESVISEFIAALYKTVIERCGTEITKINKINKIILTYPNTYTIDVLEEIKKIFVERLDLKLEGQIEFVPESDAVAAYYFNQKITIGGFGFKNAGEVKNVVIYDMGAGTLDLSLVSFKNEGEGHITATIENKIGIPLAGNYLDYIIYKSLKDKGWLRDESKINALKDLVHTIKKEIDFNDESKIGKREWIETGQANVLNKDLEGINDASYKSLFGNSLKDYLEICSKTALDCLLTTNQKVDTIVFSGRGSQFKPLRNKVVEFLRQKNNEVEIDELKSMCEDCGDFLKTCVAIGALMYQDYFNNDNPNKILNHNVYSKISVVYWGKDQNFNTAAHVENLLDPTKEDWSNAKLISGTWCKSFGTSKIISDNVSAKQMYYIQTCLDDASLKDLYNKLYQNHEGIKQDLRWAFVNLLFKKKSGKEQIPISLKISEENEITERKIGNEVFTNTKLLEDVENSLLYKRSMWPFITNLN